MHKANKRNMQDPDYYKTEIRRLILETGREGTDHVLDWLETSGFYEVAASVRFHNNFAHGLAKHSLETCQEALRLREETKDYAPELIEQLSLDSVVLCSLLHDVCKTDVYYFDSKGRVKSRHTCQMKGHGQRSVRILRELGLRLTDDEEMAVWWHMGKFEVSRPLYPEEFERALTIPLCRLIQQADSNAAKMAQSDDS